ncbi:MAG: phosphotransferase [Akkermansiaceae bacterium]
MVFRSTGTGARKARELYSPQRLVAKVVAGLLLGPLGLWRFLPSFQWGGKPEALLAKILAKSATEAEAVLLGNPEHLGRRAVILGAGKVLKIGVSGEAAKLVLSESEFLRENGNGRDGLPSFSGSYREGGCVALAMPHYADGELSRKQLIELVQRWLSAEEVSIETLKGWQMLAESPHEEAKEVIRRCQGILLLPSLMHGDLAPWNVRVDENGKPVLIDWEGGRERAIPGWDLVHFVFQTLVLVEKKSPEDTHKAVMNFLKSSEVDSYLELSGWKDHEDVLFMSYLVAMATEDSHISPILERILNSFDK